MTSFNESSWHLTSGAYLTPKLISSDYITLLLNPVSCQICEMIEILFKIMEYALVHKEMNPRNIVSIPSQGSADLASHSDLLIVYTVLYKVFFRWVL